MQEKAQMKIPLLDLGAQHSSIAGEIESAVKRVLDSQQFILGPEVRELERELAAYCQCSESVGCASGSDAILLALMACGVGPGDEVITTPFSFFATVGSMVRLQAKPVFVDIDGATFNLDVTRLAEGITSRTRAIMPVHLFGQCADMEIITQLADRNGIAVIEDAAQAIGAEHHGKRAGSLGAVGCFSFYPSKNLGGAGDGGLLTTNNTEIADSLRALRSHGAKKKYYHDRVGINSRLDSLQAAILRVKFRYLDSWTQARRNNARRYQSLFRDAGFLSNQPVRLPTESEPAFHVYNQFVIRVRERDELRAYLTKRGIGTEVYYPLPLHLQNCFKDLGYNEGDFPEAESAAREALAIPVYPELTEAEQMYVVAMVRSFYDQR
ncbi:MAG TPA: DegT/DnrJ/EryC1/StrS family aminotransferase [Blastocatellia bacterium]|nr:DegT/DnrJ/EryC1/StrS family aminotransferase [Blastocatellia bacterium]